MKRRVFFRNLVGSVAVLVSVYSTPFTRLASREFPDSFMFDEKLYGKWYQDAVGRRTFSKSIWTSLIKRGQWPEGMGDIR